LSVANVLFLHEVEFKYNLSLFIVIVTSPDMTDKVSITSPDITDKVSITSLDITDKVSITSPDITDKESIRLCIAVCFYIDSYLPLYYRQGQYYPP
jgi:hypothetical protein